MELIGAIVAALLVVSILLVRRSRERIDGLREHGEGLLRALLREREKCNALRSELFDYQDRLRTAEAEIAKIKADYEPSTRLSAKLSIARATGDQQDQRLKHQNNEMRVMMNRLNRKLFIEKDLHAAQIEWSACNFWLSTNKIEPYKGDVPGYDGKKASEREEGLAPIA